MPRFSTACLLPASVALLLAAAGCVADDLAAVEVALPSAAAPGEQAAGHELHRMLEGEKQNAAVHELPAQF
jgi:hypothetical protein